MCRLSLLFVVAAAWATATGQLAAEHWTDQRSFGRFQLRANFPLEGHDRLVEELQQLDRDVQQQLARTPSTNPVHLILFADLESYTKYLHRYFAGVPIRRALYIQGSGPGWVFAYQNKDYEVDLRHETTHALLHSHVAQVPLWLDEGLAEYYEVASSDRVYHHPHLAKVRWNARFVRPPSVESLESLRDVTQMGSAEYRAAWAWVHFLLHGPPAARQALVEYLDALSTPPPAPTPKPGVETVATFRSDEAAKGTANDGDATTVDPEISGELFAPRLRRAVPQLESEFLKHFRNWRP